MKHALFRHRLSPGRPDAHAIVRLIDSVSDVDDVVRTAQTGPPKSPRVMTDYACLATTIAAVSRPRSRRRLSGRPGRHHEETSAGGLVVDVEGTARAALIARYGREGLLRWSLPKGHVEGEETIEEAAVREVEEETGIRGRIVAPLGSIDYWFSADRRRIHKTVHHHLLLATGGVLSDADLEVAEVAWFPLAEVAGRLAHEDERRLVAAVPELLAGVT